MKYYIILQPTIRSIGGEEMYTRNKIIDAHRKGFIPLVLHGGGGDKIFIDDLKPFDKFAFPEFRFEPCVISAKRKRNLLMKLHSIFADIDNDSIIESHELLIAEWGEIIAKEFGCRHFVYILLEHNTITYEPLYKFFRFKYDRKELAGIIGNTIKDMFANFDQNIVGYNLEAFCQNTYEQIPCPSKFKLGKADYTIGSIGRTDKAYVPFMISSIRNFIGEHKDKTFNILYVGGSINKSSEKKVIKGLSSMTNARLTFTGRIFPISVEMIRQMDVCISTSGSCNVSYNCGIPTISIDGNDSKAIGVFGKTTSNSLFRSVDEPPIDIESLLERILIRKEYKKENRFVKVNVDFSTHWDFIKDMSSNKEYYDINIIQFPLKDKVKSIFLGFWYGLKPNSILNKFITKATILIFKRCKK